LYPNWFSDKWSYEFFNGEKEVSVHCGLYSDIENLAPKYDVEIQTQKDDPTPYPRDKIVLYASRGCTNKCGYCAVPRLEGSMNSFRSIKHMIEAGKREIPNPTAIVLYDNNFTEHEFFDEIVDELIEADIPVDIHGLHVESFTEHHAERFSQLKWGSQNTNGTPYLRFSFDQLKYADDIERALKLVDKYNVKAQFFCYMLFNYIDSPDDFWWRIQKAQDIVDKVGRSIYLFPQRYEPFKPHSKDPKLQGLKKNQYIGPKWTKEQVRGLVLLNTHIRGFMSVTVSKNLFNWIGRSKYEFFERMIECDQGKPLEKYLTTLQEDYPGGIIYE